MIKRYSDYSKPYIYAAFPENEEETAIRILENLSDDGVNLWFSNSFNRKEKRRLEGAFGILLFVNDVFSKSERFHEIVNTAVEYGKNILCIYLENVDMTSWINMQLGSQLALFRDNYKDESELISKIKDAQIFKEMSVTDAQKKNQRNRGLTITIIPVVAAVIIFFTAVKPLMSAPIVETENIVEKLGLTSDDLDNITELYIIGDEVFTNFVHAFYADNTRDTVYYNIETGNGQVRQGPIPVGTLTSEELEILKSMPNLKSLTIEGEQIDDLSPIFDLDLETLQLNCNPITSIDGIQKMKNLQDINISNTEISDISPLYELKSLRHVQIENTYVKDVSGLSELPLLSALQMSNTYVTELPRLQINNNICIGVSNLNIQDFSTFEHYNSFSYLQLERVKYEKVAEHLKGKRIQRLEWNNVNIQSLKDLDDFMFSNDGYLNLTGSSIYSLEGIENLEGVAELVLEYTNNLSDLTPLLRLSTLKKLSLSENKREIAENQLKDAPFVIEYR